MTSLFLNKIPDDKKFSSRIEPALIRLLSSTKRKELRNQVVLILFQLFNITDSKATSSLVDKKLGFESMKIAYLFKLPKTLPIKLDAEFNSSTDGSRDNFDEVIEPAIEQIWLEMNDASTQVGTAQFELILAALGILELFCTNKRKFHPWLRSRFFKSGCFPVHSMKAAYAKKCKINLLLGKIFLMSVNLRGQKVDETDMKILREIDGFLISQLSANDPNVSSDSIRMVVQLSCQIEQIELSGFLPGLSSGSLKHITGSYLFSDGHICITGSKRSLLNYLLQQIDLLKITDFILSHFCSLLEELTKMHNMEIFQNSQISVIISIEETIANLLDAANHIIRTGCATNRLKTWMKSLGDTFDEVAHMQKHVQLKFFEILSLVGKVGELEGEILDSRKEDFIKMWRLELLEPCIVARILFILRKNSEFVHIIHKILVRHVEENDEKSEYESM